MLVKLMMLGVWMVLVPLGMGSFATGLSEGKKKSISQISGQYEKISFSFCLGYILMWAVFQLITVPFVLKAGKFYHVELLFEIICLTFTLAGMYFFWNYQGKEALRRWKGGQHRKEKFALKNGNGEKAVYVIIWLAFLASLLFQMLQAYRLAYRDGDDAYYISISTAANLGGGMYQADPYTGMKTTLDMRHGLAPFPIWVSFIAAKCNVNAAVAAHSLMPLILIPLTYVLYLEIGRLLCADKKKMLPVFMLFVSLLQIFGNYSIYPASTFLLTRSRQGKAALGNVILPFLILLLFRIAEEIKEKGRAGGRNICYLAAAMTAGCLCSTMAGFLCSMLIMLTAFLLFLIYRKAAVLWQALIGCIPGIAYSLLYFKWK